MRHQGRLNDWNDHKGFGFVIPNGGGEKAFVHIKAFARSSRRPAVGDIITYGMSRDARGRLQATAIRFAGEVASDDHRTTPGRFGPSFALLFIAMLAGAVFMGQLTTTVLIVYAAMSAVAFMLYGLDKSAATPQCISSSRLERERKTLTNRNNSNLRRREVKILTTRRVRRK
jgi:cold shock CspA family protein